MDYTGSPSGVVITVLTSINLALILFLIRYFVKKIDGHETTINSLNITLAKLETTVSSLTKTVDKLNKPYDGSRERRYRG